MGWPEVQTALLDAISLASGVPRSHVRLAGDAQPRARELVAEVDVELQHVDYEQRSLREVEDGLEEVLRVELELVARVTLWSPSHDSASSAYAASYRALRRAHLSVVRDVLAAAGLVLRAVERALPSRVKFDDHLETVVSFSWVLVERSDEAEGPAPGGEAPREYFEAITGPALDPGADARAALAPNLAPAALRALPWRSLWLGSALDLVGGRELSGAGVAHDVPAAGSSTS